MLRKISDISTVFSFLNKHKKLLFSTRILQVSCSDWLRNTLAITYPGRLPTIPSIHSANTVNHLFAHQYDQSYMMSTSELLSLCPINTVVEGGDHILLIGLYKQILEHLIHGVLDGGVNTGGIIRT